MSIDMYFSPQKEIGIIKLSNEVYINFTSDDPIKWIMVSAKVGNKKGETVETLRDLVTLSKFRSKLKREIKKNIDKKELKKIAKLLEEYTKNGKLTQEDVKKIYKEIKKD